jgi:hypothetical protein
MRYRILFASGKVGQSDCPPFEIDTPDHYGAVERTADLARHIRGRVVDALISAPAPGSETAAPVIGAHTQILVDLRRGEGSAHYGVTTLGQFAVYPIT